MSRVLRPMSPGTQDGFNEKLFLFDSRTQKTKIFLLKYVIFDEERGFDVDFSQDDFENDFAKIIERIFDVQDFGEEVFFDKKEGEGGFEEEISPQEMKEYLRQEIFYGDDGFPSLLNSLKSDLNYFAASFVKGDYFREIDKGFSLDISDEDNSGNLAVMRDFLAQEPLIKFCKKTRGDGNSYFCLSSLRFFDLNFTVFEPEIYYENLKEFVKFSLIDNFVLRAMKYLGVEERRYFELPGRIQEGEGFSLPAFLRDFFVNIDDVFYVTDESILQRIDDDFDDYGYVSRYNAAVSDALQFVRKKQGVPIFLEGGNWICDQKNSLLITAIPDSFFDKNAKQFLVGYFLDKESTLCRAKSYEETVEKYQDWVKEEFGEKYELLIVKRNLERENVLHDFYHLDLFLAVFDDVLVLPKLELEDEQNYPFDLESREFLMQKFGLENCYEMSEEDQKQGLTNSIIMDGNIFVSSPKISQNAIDFFNKKGFNVVVPPFPLSRDVFEGTQNLQDGIRCHTNEAPPSAITKVEEYFASLANFEIGRQ